MMFSTRQQKYVISLQGMLIFYFVFLLINLSYAQQWYYSPVPRGRHINAVKILDSLHMVAGGGSESNDSLKDVFLSINKGLSWGGSSNARSPWIKSMAFSDAVNGIAVGYTGTIQRTTNRAIFWTDVPTPINRQFNKVFFQNAQTVFIVGGTVPRTDTIQTILKSTDSGKTWNILRDQQGYWLSGVYFTKNNIGIAVGEKGTILKTTNGGLNWTNITPPVFRDFKAIKFINDTIGYIVGGENFTNNISTILRTTDGGSHWTILKDEIGGILSDITFLNNSTGYICGDKATLLKTTDGGLNWNAILIPNSQQTDFFTSVDFNSDYLGVVGGLNGQTYIYTSSQLPDVYSLNAQFLDTTNCILHGGVNTHGEPALYRFYWSPDAVFTTHPFDFPKNVKSNFIKALKYVVNGLMPDTIYSYYLEVQTFAGKVQGDTLRFTSTLPGFVFKTQPATQVSLFSASLNGEINKFPFHTNLSFEWGTTPDFGNEIPAIPSSSDDTLQHEFSASVTNLLPETIYFFRSKAIYDDKTIYGNTLSFYTGNELIQTLPASIITDTTALLSGSINRFKIPITISFEYGRTIAFENEISASPSIINDSAQHGVHAIVKNLIPSTPYLFRLKGQTDFSDFYGNTLSFSTGINYGKFETGDATNITNTTARLRGLVSKNYDSIRLTFEYGTTPSLGNITTPVPFIITDSADHDVIATLSGLLTDQVYYYRLKGTSHGGMTIYGKTRQFFTGESDIPNWDFQFWEIDTIQVPVTWSFFNGEIQQVSGNTGNYALKLTDREVALNGMISDGKNGDLQCNVAITTDTPPDSVSFYLNYFIEAGDTAFVIFQMKKQGSLLFRNFYPITGNSAGEFKRLSYKIQYDSLAVPDSLTFLLLTTNALNQPLEPYHNNFMTIDDIALQPGNISFENSGFEDWYGSVIDIPLSWFNLRYFGLIPNHPDSNHMVRRVYFNEPYDFAAEIKNIYLPLGGVGQGAINSQRASIDDRKIGFPVKGRHTSLNGYYKFYPMPGDVIEVYIDMKKNGQNIGNTLYFITDTASEFTPFTIPIYYNNDADIPDSAYLNFKINNNEPVYGSRLVLDKLSFDGFVTTGVTPSAEILDADGIKVYPNPARDYIIIEYPAEIKTESILSILGSNGQLIRKVTLARGKQTTQMEVGHLLPGVYLIIIRNSKQTYMHKIIIQ